MGGMTGPKREAMLVLRAQSGDLDALDRLLRGVQWPLFRYIRGIVDQDELAEDVLQNVLILICRKLRWLREPRFFRAWAFRVASREALRSARRERSRLDRTSTADSVEAVAAGATHALAAAAENPEPLDRIEAARLLERLDSLPPASRAVLLLHYQEEMSLSEVADVMEIPLGTAKSRLAYGLERLRKSVPRGNDPSAQ